MGNTDFPEGVDAVSGASLMIDDKKIIGNAQMTAELVQSIVGGDIFEIRTELRQDNFSLSVVVERFA